MATLGKQYPFPTWENYKGKDIEKWITDSEKALEEIPEDKRISFPVADGHAIYFVKSLKPLVLQHIPFLDAYEIPDAYIRGLTRKDVELRIEQDKRWREVFSNG